MIRILYVEDNEDNVYMLSQRLRKHGFEVSIASDGEQGIAQPVGGPFVHPHEVVLVFEHREQADECALRDARRLVDLGERRVPVRGRDDAERLESAAEGLRVIVRPLRVAGDLRDGDGHLETLSADDPGDHAPSGRGYMHPPGRGRRRGTRVTAS